MKGFDSCIAESHVIHNSNAELGILKESVDCYQNTDEFIEAPESLGNV